MRLSWFGDFFAALPDAMRGLYEFGDPSGVGNGWWGFVILFIWGVPLTAIPLYLAKKWYGKHEWASATMGVIAALSIMWWAFGILPSAWIYFMDSNKEVLAGAIIPESAGLTFGEYRIDIASNLFTVIRDIVVVVEHLVAFVLTFWLALRIQKQLPSKTLASGEIKPESGGYK
ncbi:MAG: hypothetical protein ACI867_001504 [Glaciecola sp.]